MIEQVADPLLPKILFIILIIFIVAYVWMLWELKHAVTPGKVEGLNFNFTGYHGGVSEDVRFGQALGVETALLLHIEKMLLSEGINTLADIVYVPENKLYACPLCAMPRRCAIHDQVFRGGAHDELKKLALKKLGNS